MAIKVYDTLTRSLREFKPIKGNRINMFVCGPTVYDLSHLGHARTYIAYDMIAKYLKAKDLSLFYVMNITDVDDKIINRSKELGIPPKDLAEEMTREFYSDIKALKIDSVNLFAKASEHISEIIEQVQTLIEKGFAYTVNGDVYYDISKFPDYGKLSHQKAEELVKHRIDPNPMKRHPEDFALWKKHKPGEIYWESPWGKGRPGWHIEDTAITVTYFGPQYDIHGGAIELIFPHHEAEIAQAEAYTGVKPLVNFWVHTGVLTINKKKMAKSLKNFITIREALKEYSPEALRMFFISSHYRSPIDFNRAGLQQSEENVKSLNITYLTLKELLNSDIDKTSKGDDRIIKDLKSFEEEFYDAMDNDFNTPIVVSIVLKVSKRINEYASSSPSIKGVRKAVELLEKFDYILGFLKGKIEATRDEELKKVMAIILVLRDRLRSKGEYDLADEIRTQLKDIGIEIEDSPNGSDWKIQ